MDITGLVAVLGAFGIGPAIVYLRNRHRLEERKLELEARTGGSASETRRLSEDNRLLRERVENLESIVSSVDFELNQKLARTGTKVFGLYSNVWTEDSPRAPMKAKFTHSYVSSVSSTIAAGTSEIQRNIIATRGLGLPRG